MASFPILTRDTEPHGKLDAHEPAVLAYRRGPLLEQANETYRAPKSLADVRGPDEIPLPAVVLQLPDLKSTSYLRRGWRIPLATHAYWAALVLGALFALWLVFSGPKPVELPAEEAPAWTGQPAPAVERPAPSRGNNSAESSATASQWRASDSHAGATAHESAPTFNPPPETTHGVEPAAPALPEIRTASPADGAVVPQEQVEAIRTARGGETRWDGTSNRIQPSEAAPLGITTPVPQ